MTSARSYFAILLLALVLAPAIVWGQETAPGGPAPRDELDQSTKDANRQQIFTVGVMVLLGVTVAGLGLLMFVILWGHRVRRASRKPLPAAPRGDELFYLKSGQQRAESGPDLTVIPPPPEED